MFCFLFFFFWKAGIFILSFLFNWKAALVCRETLVVAGVDGEWMEILSLTFLGNTVLSLNPQAL